jgi:arginyl-tRNA synthetase
MSALTDAKKEVLNLLKATLGKSYVPAIDELTAPPDPAFGDLAFPSFRLAKGLKQNPAQVASELAAKLEPKGVVKKAEARGPYVNIFFDPAVFGQAVLQEIETNRDTYGESDHGGKKRVMIEYAQPNTHKEIHVGHLRNFFIGHAFVNLLKATGHEVIPVCYINDLGMHVAKCVWGLQKFHEGKAPESLEARMNLLGEAYAEAERAAEDPKVKEEISKIYQDLENGKGPFLALWKKTRRWSIEEMKAVFKELALPIDVWYFESDLVKKTRAVIEELKQKGIVTQSQGAWIVDLEREKLGVNLLVKSDGTLLYNAKDIALALRKEDEYHPERSYYVIDVRQSLAMQQLFATLKRMGFQRELTHLAYDFVTLPEGAMSSRKGTIIRYQHFRDEMLLRARQETAKRHEDWNEKKVEKTARAVAFAAMRFAMLRQDLGKRIVFEMEEALSFDGYTGPYLLYTLARIKSIKRKAGKKKAVSDAARLLSAPERKLVGQLASYPTLLLEVSADVRLERIAQYLFDLCKSFSEFYNEVPVLQADTKDLIAARLALVGAVGQVLENGLALLGIPFIDEM